MGCCRLAAPPPTPPPPPAAAAAAWSIYQPVTSKRSREVARLGSGNNKSGALIKAVQVQFAAIGCLRARTLRLRELLHRCIDARLGGRVESENAKQLSKCRRLQSRYL